MKWDMQAFVQELFGSKQYCSSDLESRPQPPTPKAKDLDPKAKAKDLFVYHWPSRYSVAPADK